jgi:hypothetical protein
MSGSTGHSAGRFGTDWGAEGCGWAARSAASARGSRPTDRLPLRGQVPWRKHREAACRDSKCCSCHRRPRRARSPERRLPAESMRARQTVPCVSCTCCRATSPPWRPPSLSLWRLRFTNCHQMARASQVIPHPVWGEPDLQGIWTDEFDTPFQRPAKYRTRILHRRTAKRIGHHRLHI